MGLDLKSVQIGFLFFFWGWVALSQATSTPGLCVKISVCAILQTAKVSMKDSHILEQMAESATKSQGGNKAIKGIKGLKVTDIRPPVIEMCYVENLGMSMSVISQLTIAGKSFIGGSMEITVKSNMTTISKIIVENSNLIFVVTKCGVDLISCKTNLPSSMLPKIVNKFLNSTLGKVLPGMMCPAADKVVLEMKKKMETLWEPQSIGNRGTVKYSLSGAPKITTTHARVCFETKITQKDGSAIAMPASMPAMEDSADLDDKKSELNVPVSVLNAAMELYKADLDQDVTSDTAEGGPAITSEALKEKVPTLPETHGDLKFKMRCPNTPTWTLEEGVATLTVSLTVELVAGEQSVFVLTTELKIATTFKVLDGYLQTSLGDASLENLQETSNVLGEFDREPLRVYLLEIMKVTTIVTLTKAMEDRLPLPSMMGASPEDSVTEVRQDTLRMVVGSSCDLGDMPSPSIPI